jgi:hypothetical protein
MKEHLESQVEAGEQSSVLTQSSTLPLSALTTVNDIDWEIEVISQRYSSLSSDTKVDGSQGCH